MTSDIKYNPLVKHCFLFTTALKGMEPASGGSKTFKKGAEDNLSALSSFIANAHNEIYAFYTVKAAF